MSLSLKFSRFGGPEVLALDPVDVPQPGKDEVRIRPQALGLNRVDVMYRTGKHFIKPHFPQPLGCEAAGLVEASGSDVTNVAVGDAVCVVPSFPMTEYATHAELAVVPARAVVKRPASLSAEEGAAVWMAFGTAYAGLIDFAQLSKGQSVVIPAASSSVGLAAIQIANLVGAKPIALTRSSAKRQQLMDAGAAAVVATDEEDVTARLLEISGSGVHAIFDPVAGPLLGQLMDAAVMNATVVIYGVLSPEETLLPVFPLLGKRLTIRGCDMFEVTTNDKRLAAAVAFINDGLGSGALKPTIDRVFAFKDIADAYRYLESNGHMGKVVVTMPTP